MEVSVIIPAYNEEKNIKNTVSQLKDFLGKNFCSYEIIVVNDGSTDATADIANDAEIRYFLNDRNHGKGYSVRRGVKEAKGDYIFVTDADLPYSLEYIKDGADLLESCDVVFGYRKRDMEGYPAFRRIASNIFFRFVNKLLNLPEIDTQCGFKGFRGDKAKEVFKDVDIEGFGFDIETVFLCKKRNLKYKNLTVALKNHTRSNINFMIDPFKMMSNAFKIKSNDRKGKY